MDLRQRAAPGKLSRFACRERGIACGIVFPTRYGRYAMPDCRDARSAPGVHKARTPSTRIVTRIDTGHTEALKALIAGGADVSKSTGSPQDDDMSPAEYAAQNGHGACLQLLLGAGAKPPREWGVEEGESCVFQIGQGFNMVFKTSCSTSE